MLRVEVTNGSTNQRSYVEFFDDDTIDTVRHQIGKTLDIHPDRLFILARVERHSRYYRNSEHWEALFNRLSLSQPSIQQKPFSEYQTFYRSPPTSIVFEEIERSEWMEIPDSMKDLRTEFSEYMIFGVPEETSFILPKSYDSIVMKIPAAQFPIPDRSKLFSTMYDGVTNFYCIPYDDSAAQFAQIYFPFLTETTPPILTPEEIGLYNQDHERIKSLLALKSPEPSEVSLIRTHYHIPWVGTDFGSAVRAKFEQIFYGLTVSKEVPCISLFTGTNEVSRHKFFVEKKKEPFLDISMWNSWWNNTKPSRNRPTLVLYRGKNNQYSDRVAITNIDMVISSYRPDGNTETMEDIVSGIQEWMKGFDSINPFIAEGDLDLERWNLQDLSFVAKYSKSLDEYDLRRFACISSIFDADTEKSIFRFLRTDSSVPGISVLEMTILQLMRSNPALGVADIAKELRVSTDRAKVLDQTIRTKLEEHPELLTKTFRGVPTMRFGPNTIHFSSTNRLEKSIKFANILRYILMSDGDDIDKICPKRMETVAVKEFHVDEDEVDDAIADEYADLIEGIGESKSVHSEEIEEVVPETIAVKSGRKTMYNYFNQRLQKFDPQTYGNSHNHENKYPKECEQKHQPIILSDKDLKRVEPTDYDPRKYAPENEQMVIPKGIIICPEYWCMKDEIPLREDQLINDDGFQRCPMCRGKISENAKQNPQDYPVKMRDKSFKYPRLTKYKSPSNGELMPCCYSTARTGKAVSEGKYYIMGETKVDVPALRLSFIPKNIIDSLYLGETYESFQKHRLMQAPMSGYFRVGIGRPSETLPKLLGLKVAIPSPHEKPELTMKCSFFPTWMQFIENSEVESDPLAKRIAGIDKAFKKGELSIIQELEYTALVLQCNIYRISGKSFDCFSIPNKNDKALLVLQDGTVFTAVSFVRRVGNSLSFESNVYKSPFEENTRKELEKLQQSSCTTSIPSYDNAKSAMAELSDKYSIILDPYTRGQALYVPEKIILPFQAIAVPDDVSKINGFENTKLPTHADVLKYLDVAQKYSPGYAWAEDMYNSDERVEIRLKSGLRIPVIPEKLKGESTEVIETVNSVKERNMTFSEEDQELKQTYSEISYASEVFEFLLFELSKGLDENPDIRNALLNPTRQSLEPVLKKWFDRETRFVDISKPTEFVSKIRTPCGQFKKNTCSGNVCGWDGKTCRIQIKKSLGKDALFHRLVGTLVENSKIRSVILDERVTPFFSTILYMELPHELILTDTDLKESF